MPANKKPSASKPIASIVLINKNERGVDDTLRLIGKQKFKRAYETIVVDASGGALDDIYSQYPMVKIIPYRNETGKKVTIPEQRNIGIRATRSDIVVFIDAGCEPVETWLELLIAPILDGSEKITAGGTLSSGGRTFHDTIYDSQKQQRYIGQAPTINLAIHKSVFKEVGYFDENLRYGSDMDFTWRAKNAGFKIRNLPEALITHDWGDLQQELKRADHYGQAKVILYRKHRYGLVNFAKREFTLLFYVGYVALLPLTLWFPFYPLLILVPIVKNLSGNPFKLVLINFMTAKGAVKEFLHL